jgi:hypothetical protein
MLVCLFAAEEEEGNIYNRYLSASQRFACFMPTGAQNLTLVEKAWSVTSRGIVTLFFVIYQHS